MFGKSYTSNAAAWINAVEKLGHQHLFVAGQMIVKPGIEHHYDFMVPLDLVKQALDYFGMDKLVAE